MAVITPQGSDDMHSQVSKKTAVRRKRKKATRRTRRADDAEGEEPSRVETTGERRAEGTGLRQLDVSELSRAGSGSEGASWSTRRTGSAQGPTRKKKAAKRKVKRTVRTARTVVSEEGASADAGAETPARRAPGSAKLSAKGRASKTSGKRKSKKRSTVKEREARRGDDQPGESAQEPRAEAGPGPEMVINVSVGDECRVAVVEDGRLEELFIERASAQSHVGNIYKGRVTNVEPSIQAAFVDFGMKKNGFLHISDVQPQYFPDHSGESEDVGRKIPRHNRPPIQKCFRRGQEVVVQITKEGVGTKGPALTTYLSIPGRFLVMMPGMSRHGVSRKIVDDADRKQMRELLSQLTLPPGIGFIMRTAGLGRSKREVQRDFNYLMRLWKNVLARMKGASAPAELYQESDLVTRAIRDVYTSDFTRIIVDDAETAKRAQEFLQIAIPRSKPVVEVYTDREPLFHRLGIEEQIERINMRHVPLPSGGSVVIDTTEALVAIDVNSGRFRSLEDAEETAFQINVEAAEEIARQLRLRDLGGLIVCDFIDLRNDRHKRQVERALRDALKKHKERFRTLRMSSFGLIEMTRQRQGPSLKKNIYYDCPHCRGTGQVKMPESVTLDVMRMIQLAAHHKNVQRVTATVASAVAFEILNRKRAVLSEIEAETDKELIIRGDPAFTSDQIACHCEDSLGGAVAVGGINATLSAPRETGAPARPAT